VTIYRTGDVTVVEAARLTDVEADDVGVAVATAVASGPRAVVLSLPPRCPDAETGVLRVLTGAAALARDWAGVPVVVACPDAGLRPLLETHASSAHLRFTPTVQLALAAVLRSAPPVMVSRRLAPHPTAPRAARDFVSRALLDWRLAQRIPAAVLVASELVTNAMLHARTRIDLTVATHDGSVRICVSDEIPDMTSVRQASPAAVNGRSQELERVGRGLAVVAVLSQRWGVLPTENGGKAVWAVLGETRVLP